ncbi:MAG: hypothetical protein GF334_00830 [Candidatus Altiarchaeales archaeon]|nr:hypothetical protein [Candidatus Altiarchaeales archaeon]
MQMEAGQQWALAGADWDVCVEADREDPHIVFVLSVDINSRINEVCPVKKWFARNAAQNLQDLKAEGVSYENCCFND